MSVKAKGVIAWALYDWANSAFALLIMTAVFPPFFGGYWMPEDLYSKGESTAALGWAAGLAGLVVAIAAPFLGSLGDMGRGRKFFLGAFLVPGLLATAALYLPGEGQWLWAAIFYAVANIGFSCANIFYDALLRVVATRENEHKVSALGYSFGYFGGTVLLLICLALILKFEVFGFASKVEPTKLSFLLVALWWGGFALPLFFRVPEGRQIDAVRFSEAFRRTPRQLWHTARAVWQNKALFWFLLAYWFYIDGVNTVIKMATKLGADLGYTTAQLIPAVILVQLVGVPCALLFGWLGQKFGPRLLLALGILIYMGVTAYAAFMDTTPVGLWGLSVSPIYLMAAGIGIAQGGVQTLSRSYFNSLIPSESESASFYGFFNMVGKSAAVLGPILVGQVALIANDTQSGILSLSLLFVVGLIFLGCAREKEKTA